MKNIPIHPKDKKFSQLLRDVKAGLLENKKSLLESAKREFAEAGIKLYYNEEQGLIRVHKDGAVPIDFPI